MSRLANAARLLQSNRPAEALPLLREAVALAPANPALRHDFGLACLQTNRLAEAAAAFRQAIALNPAYTDAHFHLAVTLEQQGEAHAALPAYDRATELYPRHTEAWFRAGALAYTLGHRHEAAGCFRRAAATGPKTMFGRLGAARALLTEGRDTEAERALRQTLALHPDSPVALDLLANLLADSGRFDAARALFSRAIELAPLMAGSYYDLVRCRRLTAHDSDLVPHMQQALATPGLGPDHRQRIHLALGKAADDFGDYATAMRHFDAADADRAATNTFNPAAFDAEISRLIARFTPDLLATASQTGKPDVTPVLIVGMPRSGTTLAEQILSSHPDVTGAGELNFWNERAPAWLRAATAAEAAGLLHHAANDYSSTLKAIAPRAARVTDKMPFNFLWAGLIHLAFPHATIIHMRRAAIDTALSIHQTHFNPHVAFPTGGAALVAYIRAYERLTAHWRQALPAERFIEIDYQALTSAPEPHIRRLITAIGLPWHDACLQPERNERVVKTPSKWQARQPIHAGSVDRWRRYEPWLGPLRELVTRRAGPGPST